MDIMEIADDLIHSLTSEGLSTGEILERFKAKYSSPAIINVIAEMSKLKLMELHNDKWVLIGTDEEFNRWFQMVEDEDGGGL